MEKNVEALTTPAMKQFQDIKAKYPDAILFFRMGDFYEMFMDDAIVASAILDIALTKRQNQIPMCGIPYHAVDIYVSRLLNAKKKVVICEQIKNENSNTKLLQREVVRVITPGTIVEEHLIKGFDNNFLCILIASHENILVSLADISTSDLYYFSYQLSNLDKLASTLYKFFPNEIIVLKDQNEFWKKVINESDFVITEIEESNLDFFDTGDKFDPVKKILDRVVTENFKNIHFEFKPPIVMDESEFMEIDERSVSNLDLIENRNEAEKHHSLFTVLNKCQTSSGKRLLKSRLLFPFCNISSIERIWDKIDKISSDKKIRNDLIELLHSTADIERILSRFRATKGLPRDFKTILKNIETAVEIKKKLMHIDYGFPLSLDRLSALATYLLERLSENELPAILGNGEFLKVGFNPKLDKAREAKTKGKDWILELENKEKKRLGLNTLKIRYNKVVGYYVEISRNQANSAPKEYIKKQTLVTTERFTFTELEEIERTILEADEIIQEIEKAEFDLMITEVLKLFQDFMVLSGEIGELDLMISLFLCKEEYNWTKPAINTNGTLILKDSRHPVIEKYLPIGEKFIPNNLEMNGKDQSIAILTGPNMAGKSTFMRQIALCQILFQIGSYIPAKQASLSITDKLFTRIGAGDNITAGESTFYVEMKESAYILKNKTKDSLILFDEVGRGTSTYDGLSIAWAIVEYLNRNLDKGQKTKTIFATHYHELTELERENGIFNLYLDTLEKDGKVIFLKKVRNGKAKKSFGIYVAKLAGIPNGVLERAVELLEGLESKKREIKFKVNQAESQPLLFVADSVVSPDTKKLQDLENSIKSIPIEKITPLEALQIIDSLQKKL
ncbi:MAG: DNA mismatch repair protein MutS [Leptospiraceae bacterium]|nr:DNA mismatch repair protein MutS [Leptospiraceae bacterium]MCP5497363.1 DNA mismatch repair protein MutS [Leptospiraceae bacterium]